MDTIDPLEPTASAEIPEISLDQPNYAGIHDQVIGNDLPQEQECNQEIENTVGIGLGEIPHERLEYGGGTQKR